MSKKIYSRISDDLYAQIRVIADTRYDGNDSRAIEDLLKDGLRYQTPNPVLSQETQDAIMAESLRAFDKKTGGRLSKFLNTSLGGFITLRGFAISCAVIVVMLVMLIIAMTFAKA